ncbi:MAG: peptidoglycan-binding protein, partial [Chitinophagaceae bacterium]
MNIKRLLFQIAGCITCIFLLYSCGNKNKTSPDSIADSPKELQEKATNLIRDLVAKSSAETYQFGDSSIQMKQLRIAGLLYEGKEFAPIWSYEEKWLPAGDSVFQFIEKAQLYGLFPEDYNVAQLKELREKFAADTLTKAERKDAMLWSKADILLTNAFVQLVKDVKLGRLPNDSITLRKDSVLSDDFYKQKFAELQTDGSMTAIAKSLEPVHKGYQLLKKGIPSFLEKADYHQYTKVPARDVPGFSEALQRRLFEGGYIASDSVRLDSAQIAAAVKKFQKDKGIAVDGRPGEGTIRMLNTS